MQPNDHIEPNLDAYLAGGLSPDERRDLEQHCEACSACAQQLMEGKQVDQLMDNLFAQTRPDAGLEDRALERVRRKPAAKRYGILYFALSAAAVIALGIIGAAAQAMVEGVGKSNNARVDSDSFRDLNDRLASTYYWRNAPPSKIHHGQNYAPFNSEFDADITYLNERISDVSVPGSVGSSASNQLKPIPMTFFWNDSDAKVGAGEGREGKLGGLVSGLTSKGTVTTDLGFPGSIGLGTGTMAEYTQKKGSSEGKTTDKSSADGLRIYPVGDLSMPIVNSSAGNSPTGLYYGLGSSMNLPPPPSKGKDQPLGEKKPGTESLGFENTFQFEHRDSYFTPKSITDIRMAQKTPLPSPVDVPKSNTKVSEASSDQKKAEAYVGEVVIVQPKQPEPAQPQPDAGRKIIRTGEMEFEIDSFYSSVDTIGTLLKKVTKGTGFVATSNSDKLPNGKMKGSVVVRMPPQHLDDFLAELRVALGKVGELKSQRIGSADVTKQYTDIESELRAARAVETRLIEIIKTGKGEIKDLVAAERELGTWRTKIEKMEGEIRYYNNQVSLSTITISLSEKEILAAVALVLRERVLMNIEVEEVEKAQESIASGVKAAKGRIVKNDLNVGDAGQVSAIVHVEVPPDSAPLFRELLKKLGTLSKYQADRTQQAVGGSAEKSVELKQRTDDVRFEINLYNTANIKPRETQHYKLGVADVAETYRTIREAITKMKGQIRKSDLDEKDRLNVTAELVFNVAASDRAAVDKLVVASGYIVAKHTIQAGINETATDRTVGYELTLRNVAAIPPRDIFTIALAAQDVAASYRKVHDAVIQFKGRIHKGQLNEQDKFNVSAVLDFDLATADKPGLDKLLGEVGVTISRNNEQFPAKDESTDQKVGYRLTLKNAAGTTPREKAMLAMRVDDVEARASQLKELVVASKGRVLFSKIENNKHGEMKMALIFELPHGSLDTIVRQIKDGKKPLVYDKELNPQVPDNELAMAQIALTLVQVADIVPTEEDGLSAMLRKGLSTALYIFLLCLVVIISGLAVIVPWLIPIWAVVWLVRRSRASKATVDSAKAV